jgi:hypothetical protein
MVYILANPDFQMILNKGLNKDTNKRLGSWNSANYSMIRIYSELLGLNVESLIKEYDLKLLLVIIHQHQSNFQVKTFANLFIVLMLCVSTVPLYLN